MRLLRISTSAMAFKLSQPGFPDRFKLDGLCDIKWSVGGGKKELLNYSIENLFIIIIIMSKLSCLLFHHFYLYNISYRSCTWRYFCNVTIRGFLKGTYLSGCKGGRSYFPYTIILGVMLLYDQTWEIEIVTFLHFLFQPAC